MFCECERDVSTLLGEKPLTLVREFRTQDGVRVDLEFVAAACPACRGKAQPPYPLAEIHGRTGKVERYYWREIELATVRRFAGSCSISDAGSYRAACEQLTSEYRATRASILAEHQQLHRTKPLYDFGPSVASQLQALGIEVVNLHGTYVRGAGKDRPIFHNGDRMSVEAFAASKLREAGNRVIPTESRPFHALFGTLMWSWVQDPADPRVRVVGFGGRDGVGADARGIIWTGLPDDFGFPGHADRRRGALAKHLKEIRPDTADLLWLFNYWTRYSHPLRQYLWAYERRDLVRARIILRVLGPTRIREILTYLVDGYWQRYLGWPDLLAWNRRREFFFAEVKSSSDRVREDQLRWLKDNAAILRLPVKIIKVHRRGEVDATSPQ